mgnify:CR=1 FL=1
MKYSNVEFFTARQIATLVALQTNDRRDEILDEYRDRFGGTDTSWQTLYATLMELRNDGLVETAPSKVRPDHKGRAPFLFVLTDKGERACEDCCKAVEVDRRSWWKF